MFWFKHCSRCGGDLHLGTDLYGEYLNCLQCGYILSDVEQTALLTPQVALRFVGAGDRQEAKAA